MSGFHNERFPTDISWGSAGGPGSRTEITELASGHEQRVSLWDGFKSRWNVAYGVKTTVQLTKLVEFYIARQGAANGFPYKDWGNMITDPVDSTYNGIAGTEDQDCIPAAGDGSNVTFQLARKYISGATSVEKKIFLPRSGFSLWLNGVLQTITTHYTVDLFTGLVTMVTAPPGGQTMKWSGEYDHPVRFSEGSDQLLSVSLDAFDIGGIPDIELVEILDPAGGYLADFLYGGAKQLTIGADTLLSVGEAFLWRIEASAGGLAVKLPDPLTLPQGRDIFEIINSAATSFAIKTHTGSTLLAALAQDEVIGCAVHDNSGTPTWIGS